MTKSREVDPLFVSSNRRRIADHAELVDVCLGKVIRRRRLVAGIIQEALGEPICVSYQQIQRYETGANGVSFSRLLPIAAVLNCTAADLVVEAEQELQCADFRILKRVE